MRKILSSRAGWLSLAAALAAAAAIGIAACGGGGSGGSSGSNPGQGLLAITPIPINLRATTPTMTAQAIVHIANPPGSPRSVEITSIAITGDTLNVFSASPPTMPVTVSPGASISMPVGFMPNGATSASATFEIQSNDSVPVVDIPMNGLIGGEFQINETTDLDQTTPAVSSLPLMAPINGAIAVVIFQNQSDFAHPTNPADPHATYVIGAIDSNGNSVEGIPEPKLCHHTENIGYIGIKPDPTDTRYAATTRYSPNNVSTGTGTGAVNPHSVFMNTIDSPGTDFGGVPVLDTLNIDPSQLVSECDVAVDTNASQATRFCTFRVSNASTAINALPVGILGRLIGRFGEKLTPLFGLSSAPNPAQANPRIDFNGSTYLAVWELNGIISGRFFDRSGSPRGNDFAISTGGGATLPRLAHSPTSGDFFVVWQGIGIEGRLVGSDGSTGPLTTLSSPPEGQQTMPAVAGKTDGTWMVVWVAPVPGGTGIFARKFSAELVASSLEAEINVVGGALSEPDVNFIAAMNQWVVVWTGTDQSGKGIKGRFIP
jgi:hypothetical protein